MKKEILEGALSAFTIALDKLNISLKALSNQGAKDEYLTVFEDAVIKRFEVAFEYFWKLLKTAAEYEGGEVFGPRPAIQEATRFGWIDDPEFWADALEARNGSVHDYFGVSRMEYLKIVRKFAKDSANIAKKIAKIKM